MGAGRRIACPHCGDPLQLPPNDLDVLEQDVVQCPRCRQRLAAQVLFEQLTSGDALTQIRLTSNWWESDQLDVVAGIAARVSLGSPVTNLTVGVWSLSPALSAVAQVVDASSFLVIPFAAAPAPPGPLHGSVAWQALGRVGETGIPAWLEFLDAARVAWVSGNGRGAVLEGHAALDAFLTDHLAERLRAKGFAASAAEWLVGRIVRFDERLGPLLEATDGFELRRQDRPLWTALDKSNKLRNRLIHHINEAVPNLQAQMSVTAVMALARLLDPPLFWRAMFGFAGLPRDAVEVLEAPVRSCRVRLGTTMAVTPTVTLSGPCASHLSVSDVTPQGFTVRHQDPLDHPWDYAAAVEANP